MAITGKIVFLGTCAFLLSLACPLQAFVNNQNAANVLGEQNFTDNFPDTTQTSIKGAMSIVYTEDFGRKLVFVSETQNARVLIYDITAGITNGMAASYVLGEADFTSTTGGTLNTSFVSYGLAYDKINHRLFASDAGNNRVLIFDLSGGLSSSINGMSASYVLGQTDFTSRSTGGTGACLGAPAFAGTSYSLDMPTGLGYDSVNQHLFVSDNCNFRVLVFDVSLPTLTTCAPTPDPMLIKPGCSAINVLGQPNFQFIMLGGDSYRGVWWAGQMEFDPIHNWLFIADQINNRVTVFDGSPANLAACGHGGGSPACKPLYVLGQPDLIASMSWPIEQHSMGGPNGVTLDLARQRLFVADTNNGRILQFNLKGGISNGMNASAVLGQSDFQSRIIHAVNSQNSIYPMHLSYDSGSNKLFAVDAANRILVFDENDLAGTSPACSGSSAGNPKICGTITAAESTTTALPNIPVDLLDFQGKLLATHKTDSSGMYQFDNLSLNATYYVTPVMGRTESAAPSQYAIPQLQSIGGLANMQIRGVPSALNIATNAPGSSILISAANYTGTNAPSLNPKSSASKGFYSATSQWNGKATVQVPPGNYYVTCWVAQQQGSQINYVRTPASGSNGPFSISPNAGSSATCSNGG